MGGIRTPGPLIRSQVLYPAELPLQRGFNYNRVGVFARGQLD